MTKPEKPNLKNPTQFQTWMIENIVSLKGDVATLKADAKWSKRLLFLILTALITLIMTLLAK